MDESHYKADAANSGGDAERDEKRINSRSIVDVHMPTLASSVRLFYGNHDL